jgi:hypothetical protein
MQLIKKDMSNKILMPSIALFIFFGKANGQYCTKGSRYTEVPTFNNTQLTIGTNIQYGIATDFKGNPNTLLMDLYYPKLTLDTSAKRPFIIVK